MFRYNVLFRYVSDAALPLLDRSREGGWSEGVVHPTEFDVIGPNPLVSLIDARCGILPMSIRVIGIRVQDLNVRGSARILSINKPGLYQAAQDIAQMSLVFRQKSADHANILHTTLRGIPDDQIVAGTFVPKGGFLGLMGDWMARQSAFYTIVRDIETPTVQIDNIKGDGTVTLLQDLVGTGGLVAVRVLRTRDSEFIGVGGRFLIDDTKPIAARQFTLKDWIAGATKGGNIRLDKTYAARYKYDGTGTTETSTRKVGRPFGLLRGRRSIRR
jgi:hypothetical protein